MSNKNWFASFLVLLLVVNFTLTGCEPLRKKFTRQKKMEKESTEVPILEPIEYPDKIHSVEQLYREHYSLYQVWVKDLLIGIKGEESVKRKIYNLDQVLSQLKIMQQLVSDEKRKELAQLSEGLENTKNNLKEGRAFDSRSLELNIERIDRRVREGFKLDAIKDHLLNEVPADFILNRAIDYNFFPVEYNTPQLLFSSLAEYKDD